MNNFEKLGLEGIAKLLSNTYSCESCPCWDECNTQTDCYELIKNYLMEEALPAISACPFCGNATAQRIFSAKELYSSYDSNQWAVICDANNGGCGASSSFCEAKAAAVKKWNKRATPNKAEWIEERRQIYDKFFEFIESDSGLDIFDDNCAEDFLSKYFHIDADLCDNYSGKTCSECWKDTVPIILASNDYITEVKEKCGE